MAASILAPSESSSAAAPSFVVGAGRAGRSGVAGSAFGDPAVGTFGTLERNALRGPYYRRTDASIFKHFRLGGTRDLEIRIEAVNLFNVVNLGNPDSEVGTVNSPRPNAGRISSTAYFGADPQRNLQFAVKFRF